jgi:hypothetical protein
MTDTHGANGHSGGAATQTHFSDGEWQSLRTEDLSGAKAVVGLMMGIFIIGLVLYLFVAWWVSS